MAARRNLPGGAIAFDRGSARSVDAQGFLHVEGCNISKAGVNPYWGAEIPDYEKLGLQPDRVYYLFRDPKELEKAAATFNNLPLMDNHIEVSADDMDDKEVHDRVVGSTGTNARFEDPYLINDLVVWTTSAIDGVMSKTQTQLSCAYRYELDMTPGTYMGQKYDGRMHDLQGNHVALVDEGRAGPDVTVKDRKPAGVSKLNVKVNMKGIAKLVSDALAPAKQKLGMKPGAGTIDSITDDLTSTNACATKMKGGVTSDENPEGHNQYSGAASYAGRSSAKAIKSKDAGSHEEASAAHAHAARLATSAGPKAWHENMAAAHEAAARGVPVKFGRNFGDQPKIGAHDSMVASDVIAHMKGHKDASGKLAPWVIKSESTGRIIWSGPTKEEAVAQLKNVEGHKAHDSVTVEDDNPEGINQYSGGGGSKASAAKASVAAQKASAAVRNGTGSSKAAAAAHRAAAKAHWEASQKAPTQAERSLHEKLAAGHERAENNLLRRS
jgi:hypothetical protein